MNSYSRPIQRPTFPCCSTGSPRHNGVMRDNTSRSDAGAILGSATGGAKARAAKANGEKGGRPKGS